MRPATIRRLLVFGVCLVGVACLQLVPGLSGSAPRTGSSATELAPPASTTGSLQAPDSAASTTSVQRSSGEAVGPGIPRTGDLVPHRIGLQTDRTATHTATAVDPGQDETAPTAVRSLTVLSTTSDRLAIGWPAADDDIGVTSYSVWLNGFLVLVTQQTRATLTWFNDSDTHVIQVRAFDAAGNGGPSSPTLLVRRPIATAPPTSPNPSPMEPMPDPASTTSPGPADSAVTSVR